MVSAQAANFFFSAATLLSGDLDGCPALPDLGGDCVGGLASVAAVMRRSERAGDGPGLFAPVLDRQSRLVHVSEVCHYASEACICWRVRSTRPSATHSHTNMFMHCGTDNCMKLDMILASLASMSQPFDMHLHASTLALFSSFFRSNTMDPTPRFSHTCKYGMPFICVCV
jgi:hypothetical protein